MPCCPIALFPVAKKQGLASPTLKQGRTANSKGLVNSKASFTLSLSNATGEAIGKGAVFNLIDLLVGRLVGWLVGWPYGQAKAKPSLAWPSEGPRTRKGPLLLARLAPPTWPKA